MLVTILTITMAFQVGEVTTAATKPEKPWAAFSVQNIMWSLMVILLWVWKWLNHGIEIGLILYCVMAILLIGTRQGLWAGGCRTNEWPCGGLEDSETLLKYNNRNVTQGGVWVNLTWIWYLYLYHGTYIIFIARTIYAKIYNESNMPGENCGTELGYMIVELDLLIKIKKGTQEYSEGLYDTLWDFFIGVAPRPIGHA